MWCLGAQAKIVVNISKGKPVLVEGRLKLDSWKDNDGQNRSKHSIVAERVVFLGSANAVEAAQEGNGVRHVKSVPLRSKAHKKMMACPVL